MNIAECQNTDRQIGHISVVIRSYFDPLVYSNILPSPLVARTVEGKVIHWKLIEQVSTLTHWGRVTHICVSILTIIGADNGLSPVRHQAIICTSAGIVVNWNLRSKFQWNLERNAHIFIQENVFEIVSAKWRPFCLGLYVFTYGP